MKADITSRGRNRSAASRSSGLNPLARYWSCYLRVLSTSLRHFLLSQREALSRLGFIPGTSSARRPRPSGSIQRPRIGRMENTPPRMNRAAEMHRMRRREGTRSHVTAEPSHRGNALVRCSILTSQAASKLTNSDIFQPCAKISASAINRLGYGGLIQSMES